MSGNIPAKPFGTPAVLKPGETPPFPVAADHLDDAAKNDIAAAAWKEARGSIKAFGLLVQEHLRGEIDLLAKPGAKPAAEVAEHSSPPAASAAAPAGPAAPVIVPAKTA